jgi:hypothetical protein
MAAGLIAGYRFLMAVMILLAATSLYTVFQRIRHVHRVAAATDSGSSQSPSRRSFN